MLTLAATALILWLIVLALPWRPCSCREGLEPSDGDSSPVGDVTVLMPARNEAVVIRETLRALAVMSPDVPVVLVDDQSSDGTADLACACGLHHLDVLAGTSPPAGWTGKLWAMEQGLAHVATPWVLLLDADIRLAPGMLAVLQHKAAEGYALVSLCAEPCWKGLAARWLMPAFVYFFKLLYPFALANREGSRVAAAAGGVILIKREVLIGIGGFAAWHDEIIDDCTLAAHVKRAGYLCFLGLTHGAVSLRQTGLRGVIHMIARTAFVQLGESWLLLWLVSLLMGLAFCVPVIAACTDNGLIATLGILAWLASAACFMPTLHYYRRNPLAAVMLPLTAAIFLAATWYSALRALGGTRSAWKGRRYGQHAGE
ncbi:MAG TPA: glycosyltransferase [Rhodanobacteraceae bacterium]